MASESMKFTLDFLAKTGGLKDAAKLTSQLEAELDDTEDAAKSLAKAMGIAASAMEADIKETTEIAERLSRALGPEMTARVDVDSIASKFRAAGLSVQQVDANIDELTDGLKRMDAVGDQAAKSVDRIGKDQSGSVRANYLGNASSDMANLAGATGSANVAIGQFVEYTADGNINLKSMAKMAGPLIGVGIAMQMVADQQKRVAEAKAWRKEQIDGFVKSLREGEDAAEGLADRLEEAGEIQVKFGGVLDEMIGGDLVDDLAAAGVSVDQFAEAATGGTEGLQGLQAALEAAGVSGEEITRVMTGAAVYQDMYNQSIKTGAELEKVFGSAVDETAEAQARHKRATEALTGVLEDQTDALTDAIDGMYDLEEATEAGDRAYREYEEALAAANATANDANVTDAERADILADLRGQQREIAKGALETAQAYSREQGATDGTRAATALQIAKLEELKKKYPLLAAEIQRYIDKLKSIPNAIHTNVSVGGNTGVKRRASGGPVSKGDLVLKGENGPELEIQQTDGHVFNASDTKRMLSGGGGLAGGTNVNINVTVGPGGNPVETGRAVADALRSFYDSGGQRVG